MLYVIIEYISFKDTFKRNRGTINGVDKDDLTNKVLSRRRVNISGEGRRSDERNFKIFKKLLDVLGKFES